MACSISLSSHERVDRVNCDITLIQNRNGLTFGTDAYLLAAYMGELKSEHALELGGGTGVISLLLAARGHVRRISVLEIQPEFCRLIERNASANSLGERLSVIRADLREVKADTLGGEADTVFTNPPYMRSDSGKRNEHDEKYIARHEVFGGIYDFCQAADRLLKFGGRFYCVWRPDRLIDLIDALRKSHLEPKRMTFVHADKDTGPSMVLVEAKKGAAPSLIMTPPLMLHDPMTKGETSRTLSKDAARIYDTGSFADFFNKKR